MSIPIRFTTTFQTSLGDTHTLEILDTDWVASTINMKLGSGGVNLEYAAEATGQDRFEPLIPFLKDSKYSGHAFERSISFYFFIVYYKTTKF